MARRFRGIIFISAILLFTVLFTTCDLVKVGLGSKVDISPPTVDETAFPNGAYVRGTIQISGAATDDTGVQSVKVSVSTGSGNPTVIDAVLKPGT
jgi:hypothetical protein